MVAAIDVYNKPDFPYRAESFAILAINAWELLLKAKWLTEHNNDIRSLYVRKGKGTKRKRIKKTRAGNPFTYGLDYLAAKLVEQKMLDTNANKNLEAILELRNSVVHFYYRSPKFAEVLQELGTATVKNFVAAVKDWFDRDLSEFNFYLMPLSFMALPPETQVLVLNREERRFLDYLQGLRSENDDPAARYSVIVNVEVRFTRSKTSGALAVQVTNDPNAPAIRLTEEQIREKYPWDYKELTARCKKRYSDFKVTPKYHQLRQALYSNQKLVHVRYLDPENPKSGRKLFFNPNILQEFDKHYTQK
jgi:hypothetical protein